MLHQARLVILAALFVSSAAMAAPKPVTLAPVTDKDYAEKVLAPRKGKAVLVTFWASYCVPCLAELPALFELKAKMQKRGADVVLVNVDPPGDPGQIQRVITLRKLPKFDSLHVMNEDPQPFIDAVDKKWMGEVPYAVIYGKDGALKKAFSGEQKASDLEKALAEAL